MLSGLASELAAGAVSLSPAAWLGIQALIAVALIIVSVLVWGTVWLGLLALIGVPAVFTLSLRMRVERRQRAFADELPDFLLLLASALRAGLSFTQALESSADQNHGEVGRQIRRALAEAQVGSDLDSALMACAVRMDNEDLRWTVTALGLQREVGGNLSSILDGAAATIRERHALGREVRTLSAEGRLSAYVLMALPVGVFLFLLLFRREYVSQLWSSPLGIAMMVALVVLMLLGWIWMRAIVRIRV
jgi:tight adherence protein B